VGRNFGLVVMAFMTRPKGGLTFAPIAGVYGDGGEEQKRGEG